MIMNDKITKKDAEAPKVLLENNWQDILKSLFDEQTENIVQRILQREEFGKEVYELTNQIKVLQVNADEDKYRISSLEQEKNHLKKVLEETIERELSIKQQLEDLKEAINSAEQEKTSWKMKADQLQEIIEPYNDIIRAYECFISLSHETRVRISNIYVSENLKSFLAASMQWENIEGLWNYIKRNVIEGDYLDFDYLHRIFVYLFDIYTSQSVESNYKLINPLVGTRYDSDKHIIMGTKTDGFISKVLLEGIENTKTKRLIGKAIIEV